MRPLRVVGAIGAITRLFSMAFLLPVLFSMAYDPYDATVFGLAIPRDAMVFLACAAGTFLLGTGLRVLARSVETEDLQEREAYLTVGVGWILLTMLAAVPFMLSGTLTHPIDAFFEAMSGITTTGATVIAGELEAVSKSVMIWRSFLQFLGGMGIIVLSVALLARLSQGGMQLLQAEAPGPTVQRVAPRLAQTAQALWRVYLLFFAIVVVVFFAILAFRGFGPKEAFYEAFLHGLTTIATGGFSNHTDSIAYFDDWLLEAAITFFILVSGVNYTLHYHALRGKPLLLWKDREFRFFAASFLTVTLVGTLVLVGQGQGFGQALRGTSFTFASLITSTGYATVDYDLWPGVLKFLLLLVMVTGATAGSTSGGMKHVRILLLFRLVRRELTRIRHPKAVIPVRLAGRVIQNPTIMATVGFFFAYITLFVLGMVILIAFDPIFQDPVDAASASISAISNMGPALGVVGPTRTYAGLTDLSKLTLSLLMWIGRLEIFTALIVLTPRTWRN